MPSKRLKLTREMVAAAREMLDAIPPAARELCPVTVSEAIRTLTPTIRRLLERGHSREAVLLFLKEQGIECSASTLKEHYRPGRGKTGAKAPAEAACNGQPNAPSPALLPAANAAVPAIATTSQPTAPGRVTANGPGSAKSPGDSRADQRPSTGLHPGTAKAS